VNNGIAVDTDAGCRPGDRDADKKNIVQLSVSSRTVRESADRKISLEEMQAAASASPIWRHRGTYFTPIVNAPESRSSASRARAWSRCTRRRSGQFTARLMLPLSLSYDHRVIDGADANPLPALGRGGARATVPSRASGLIPEPPSH